MNKGLSKILLGALGVFIVAVMLDGTSLTDLADAFYTLVGTTWLILGTWLAVRVLMDKEQK